MSEIPSDVAIISPLHTKIYLVQQYDIGVAKRTQLFLDSRLAIAMTNPFGRRQRRIDAVVPAG
jgi:hypothetical protein